MDLIDFHDQQQLLASLVDRLSDAVLVLDDAWRISYANKHAQQISHISPESINRDTLWELYPEIVGTDLERTYREAVALQQERRVEAFYYEPFKTWYELLIRPLGDGVLVEYRDVTALIETARALHQSEEQTRFALTAANGVGTWDWDNPKNLIFANSKFALLYGVDPDQARIGASMAEFKRHIHPDDQSRVESRINEAIQTGDDFAAEYRLVQADGSVCWVSTIGRCNFDDAGRPSRFPGVAIDVTVHKQIEAERHRQDEYLRLLLDSTAEAFYAVDRDGLTTSCNRAFLQMLGFDNAGQAMGRKLHAVIHHSHPDGSPYKEETCPIYRAARSNLPAHVQNELFFRVDGTSFPVEYSSYPILDGNQVKGAVTTFTDITERKRTEAALIKSEKLAAVGRLASSIAHEINNPLESVTNLIFLARNSADHAEVQRYLEVADRELRRVSNITGQTLRFHRQSTKPREISCLDLFSTVLTMHEGKLKNANIRIEKRKRANRAAKIYEADVRQVLNNVVGNAIDAMPLGGRLLVRSREATNWTPTLTGLPPQPGLMLTIADTGAGMDRATLARVFEAFFTTKGINGTGLGLWISSEIMERHGGRIKIRSKPCHAGQPGQSGTVVTLFLPFTSAA